MIPSPPGLFPEEVPTRNLYEASGWHETVTGKETDALTAVYNQWYNSNEWGDWSKWSYAGYETNENAPNENAVPGPPATTQPKAVTSTEPAYLADSNTWKAAETPWLPAEKTVTTPAELSPWLPKVQTTTETSAPRTTEEPARWTSADHAGWQNDENTRWRSSEPARTEEVAAAAPVEPEAASKLHENTVVTSVHMQKMDGSEVAYMLSAKGWEELELPDPLLHSIYARDYLKPSKIQAAVLPHICHPKSDDMVVQAQNGSGKTACFTIAMLTKIDVSKSYVQALVLAPTRELIHQTETVVQELGKDLRVQCRSILPQGTWINSREDVQEHILLGTPGKIEDLCRKQLLDLTGVTIFVLDEADMMLDQENNIGPQVAEIRKHHLPKKLQVLLFSATYPDKVRDFAFKIIPDSLSVQLKKEQLNVRTITHLYKKCYNDSEKYTTIKNLFGCLNAGQSIIFVNSRRKAFDIAKWLRDDDHAVSLICGTQSTGVEKMDPKFRDKVMEEFRAGQTRVLVATDVLSRGIDVPAVTLVINYEFPMQYGTCNGEGETYLHRVGRTGRFGMRGIAINLLHDNEESAYFDTLNEYKIHTEALQPDLEVLEATLRSFR